MLQVIILIYKTYKILNFMFTVELGLRLYSFECCNLTEKVGCFGNYINEEKVGEGIHAIFL